jgi:hypothetical protein
MVGGHLLHLPIIPVATAGSAGVDGRGPPEVTAGEKAESASAFVSWRSGTAGNCRSQKLRIDLFRVRMTLRELKIAESS